MTFQSATSDKKVSKHVAVTIYRTLTSESETRRDTTWSTLFAFNRTINSHPFFSLGRKTVTRYYCAVENLDQSLSVVVPTRSDNVQKIKLIIQRIEKMLKEVQGNHEIILVDDFSGDGNSYKTIEALRSEKFFYPIKFISLAKWVGQIQATRYGLENCSRNWVLTLDDDKSLDSISLKSVISQTQEFRLDFMVCVPINQEVSRTLLRNFSSSLIRNIGRIAYRTNKDHSFSSIVLFKSAYIVPLSQGSDFMTIPGWFYNSTSRFGNIQVNLQYFSRPSNYSFWKLIRLFMQLLQVVERRTLKALSMIFGFGIFVALIYFFANFYTSKSPPSGYLSLFALTLSTVAISLLNGLFILSLRSYRLINRESRIYYEISKI